ncbi:MAG: hypothetical protein KIT22_08520 [Verrucomicrobiae bacterium]|nr:hypothetical protein [Verrucomicrobiae bacterium]
MALESALHDLRGSGRTVQPSAAERPSELADRARREHGLLIRWARREERLLDGIQWRARVTGGGAEHNVFFDDATQRYFKLTIGGGLTIGSDYRIGKRSQRWLTLPFVREATPREYLERLALFNQVFGDDLRLEGVIADAEPPCVVTSQPVIHGRETTAAEIAHFLTRLEFQPVPGVVAGRHDSVSFYRPDDRVAVFDAHGENFLTDHGHVAPIDAFIIRVEGDLHAFLTLDPRERDAEIGRWVSSMPVIR